MNLPGENLRFILGIKLKQFRHQKGYSLKELAEKTNLSLSYLSEIEKGKKYPKPEKILQLARALNISFDELVSLKVNEELDSLKAILNSPFIQEFPFHLFGIEPQEIVDLVTNSPSKAGALIRTLLEIGQSYGMQVEHFLFAALRSYQQLHQNYFEDIEKAVSTFVAQHQWKVDPPIYGEQLRKVLIEEYGYILDETTLAHYPELQGFRSVWINRNPPKLLINRKLLPSQKAFILGREIGYCFLGLKERATTSSWLKVESFEQVLNNFKASYFSGALLINKDLLCRDLEKFFQKEQWEGKGFLALMRRYEATPEMFLYRLTELVPRFFGLHEIHFLRFNHEVGSNNYSLTKLFNMSQVFVPHGLGLNEHHCRRWLSIRLLKELAERQKRGERDTTLIAVQRSRYLNINAEFFTITLARPLALSKGTNSSVTLSFLINDQFKKTVRFWNDPHVPTIEVNETCERCGLSEALCRDRVAPPTIYQKEQTQKIREKALQQLLQEV
ncbi:MAG TPA: XRE family transcriptional regulator [Candidatus Limnocylindrales bacterium]|nr:XRE family transcriptional regulator [Candidatus Limnocylindrales bacterium]